MRIKLFTSIMLISTLVFFLPLVAVASGEHDDEHPPKEVVEQAIEKLEEGEFVEAEEDLQGILSVEHHEGVKIELVKQALTALEEGEEEKAIELLKGSIEKKEGDKH